MRIMYVSIYKNIDKFWSVCPKQQTLNGDWLSNTFLTDAKYPQFEMGHPLAGPLIYYLCTYTVEGNTVDRFWSTYDYWLRHMGHAIRNDLFFCFEPKMDISSTQHSVYVKLSRAP